MRLLKRALILVAVLTLAAATVAFAGSGRDGDRDGRNGDRGHKHRGWHPDRGGKRLSVVKLRTADGDRVGKVWLRERRRDRGVVVFARVRNLPPGFHGFHVHTTGRCDPPAFTSAGGHLNPSGAGHGDHAGDLPSLLVNEDGRGMLAAATDRFSLSDLRDSDGSAVMVHSGRDNFANIPARYGGPDQETLATGDAGSRLACGVVR
jgi:Cu-Zn family superoxide dismutase